MAGKVIVIGPSIERTKGGIATVIQGLLDSDAKQYGYQLIHFTSHVEGSGLEKMTFFLKALLKLIVTRNITLVHIHTACDASFYRKGIYAIFCHLKRVPVVMHIHGADFDSFYLNAKPFIKNFIKSILKNCDRVIVLSGYWKAFFQDNLSLNNIEVLFNAVNCDEYIKCNTAPQNINNFLFLGRLGQRKGIYDLIKSIDILLNKQKQTHLKFYFAGDGEVEEVKKIVSELKLDNNVEILGWVDSTMKAAVFLKVDTVVLPSYNEGLPVALLEAMAAGKVILSTNVGGIPDLVKNDVNGYLISPGDVEALTNYIKQISQSPDKMINISKNNIDKIQKQFNSVYINEQLFKLYDEILATR